MTPASITKILLTGIFGIFSQTLTQLVAQTQEEENNHDSDENYTHYRNHKPRKKHTFRRHSTVITHTTDCTDNDKPAEIYVDTNYKHYNTTIRTTLETKSENKLQTLPPQLITPPPAYQCLGNNVSFPTTPPNHNKNLPSAPNIQQ